MQAKDEREPKWVGDIGGCLMWILIVIVASAVLLYFAWIIFTPGPDAVPIPAPGSK